MDYFLLEMKPEYIANSWPIRGEDYLREVERIIGNGAYKKVTEEDGVILFKQQK